MVNGRSSRKDVDAGFVARPSRLRELLAIVLVVVAALLALALATHHQQDCDGYQVAPHCRNMAGMVGAFISYWLFQALGVSVYAFPLLLAVLAVFTYMRMRFPSGWSVVWRSVALLALMVASACLCDLLHTGRLAFGNVEMGSAGGFIGKFVNDTMLRGYCGTFGAFIILVGVALVCVIFLFETNLRRLWWLATVAAVVSRTVAQYAVQALAWIGMRARHGVVWCVVIAGRLPLLFRRSPMRPRQANIVIVGADAARKQREARRKTRKKESEPGDDMLPLTVVEPLPAGDDEPEEAAEPLEAAPTKRVAAAVGKERVPAGESASTEDMPPYVKPDIAQLDEPQMEGTEELKEEVEISVRKLEETFKQFNIDASVGDAICGPVITCYEVHPAPGTQVKRITSLEHDLALAMKAKSIRIVAPIPGRDAIGIELPNAKRRMVTFSQLVHSDEYVKAQKKMAIPLSLGQTLSGETFVDDLSELPHLLVAGTTGSGKSVCINTILLSLLLRFDPEDLKMILVDPKHVELVPYHNLPHLLIPVLNDPGKVPDALDWLIVEMEKRYKYFARVGVRNIAMYNAKRKADHTPLRVQVGALEYDLPNKLPYIVLVIDELADLMMVAADEVERKIIRLAQLARAAGIHMVLATQRPSTDVITGLIKANIPARIAFRTSSGIDSRVIMDESGSEKLLGKGDMLYKSPTVSRTMRVQGAFISEDEVRRVTTFVRDQRAPQYVEIGLMKTGDSDFDIEMDDKFDEAILAVIESGQASASYLQRRLSVGYARAARLVDLMEARGLVGPKRGAKPRDILVEKWPPDES